MSKSDKMKEIAERMGVDVHNATVVETLESDVMGLPSHGVNKWRNVDMAPRDGTTILSDMGFVRYFRQADVASPIDEGWHMCDLHGWPMDLNEDPVEIDKWLPMDILTPYEW